VNKHKRRFIWTVGRVALLGVAAAAAGSSAGADETFYCNRYITTVPYVIRQPGHYCLSGNLTTAMTSGVAITIAANFVWLDLNNFALDGSAAGLGTAARGIDMGGQKHVTVRNGTVRGFQGGIFFGIPGSAAEALTIEGMQVDRNTREGISIEAPGEDNVVRGNRISNTGGTTFTNLTGITGLSVVGDVSVIDNEVVNTFSPPSNQAYGIIFGGTPGVSYKAVVVNNRVTKSSNVGIARATTRAPRSSCATTLWWARRCPTTGPARWWGRRTIRESSRRLRDADFFSSS
jgi:hypothetical protein